MTMIEFETPTLDNEGEVIARTLARAAGNRNVRPPGRARSRPGSSTRPRTGNSWVENVGRERQSSSGPPAGYGC